MGHTSKRRISAFYIPFLTKIVALLNYKEHSSRPSQYLRASGLAQEHGAHLKRHVKHAAELPSVFDKCCDLKIHEAYLVYNPCLSI